YGVADLRSATDSEVIQRLLNIADSRFQDELLAAAQAAGKVARDYRIPAQHRHNTPGRIASVFAIPRRAGLFTEYPFGTDLTSEEIRLAQALTALAAQTTTARGRAGTFIAALRGGIEPGAQQALARMGLAHPRGWRERLARRLVALALRRLSV